MEKDTLTNAERLRLYKENNPKCVESNQLRQISKRQEANKYPEIGKQLLKNAVKMCQKYLMFCFEPIQGLNKGWNI